MIGKNIKKFRNQSRMTQLQLAEKANISRSYLADVENGRYNVSLDVLKRIAGALNVSTARLLGEEQDPMLTKAVSRETELDAQILAVLKDLTDDEGYFYENVREPVFNAIADHFYMAYSFHDSSDHRRYEKHFREFFESPDEYSPREREESIEEFNKAYNYRTIKQSLKGNDLETKEKFLSAIEKINESYILIKHLSPEYGGFDTPGIPLPEIEHVKLPVLGSIAGGTPNERIENIEGYEWVEKDVLRGREGFILRVKGDSMIGDGIADGDSVVVVKQTEVNPNDIAVVAVNDHEATLKRVKREGDFCMLIPSNPDLQPLLVKASEVHIIGKVIQARKNFE